MAEIKIDINGVINASFEAEKAKNMVGSIVLRMESTRWKLNPTIRNSGDIEKKLINLHNRIKQIEQDIHTLYTTANQSANQYMATEQWVFTMSREIAGMQTAINTSKCL